MFELENKIRVMVRSGKTNEILCESEESNDIADDFLCGSNRILTNNEKNVSQPYCFLLPDGAAWTGFTFDSANPSAPYCINFNDYSHTGAQLDSGADLLYKTKQYLAPPFDVTNNPTQPKWKFFFRWTALPVNISLKAVALTAWQNNNSDFVFGAEAAPAIFIPDTLAVLPFPITVQGRNPTVANSIATQTADILEVSYFLSIVGA